MESGRVIDINTLVADISMYIHSAIYMEQYGIKMSTVAKVKTIDILLRILGIFTSNEYLEYAVSDMDCVYIKRESDENKIHISSSKVDDICKTIYDMVEANGRLFCYVIPAGESRTSFHIDLYEYLKSQF